MPQSDYFDSADELLRFKPDLRGEPVLSSLCRALIDERGKLVLRVMPDGSVVCVRSGSTLIDSAGNLIGNGAPANSPAFTGTPTAPTAPPGSSTNQLATTAFVSATVAGIVDPSNAANIVAGTLSTARLDPSVPVDLPRLISSAVDGRIAGLPVSPATLNLYSTYQPASGVYTRSATSWAAGIGLSGVSVAQGHSAAFPVTALSSWHVAIAAHVGLAAGTPIEFLGVDGAVVPRTLAGSVQAAAGVDIQIGLLNAALPSTVVPIPILPADWITRLGGAFSGLPVLAFNQLRQALIGEVSTPLPASGEVQIALGRGGRAGFSTDWIVGDSSSPVFVLVGSLPYLLSTAHTGTNPSIVGAGPGYYQYLPAILSAMAALGPVGTALASAAAFPAAPTLPWSTITGVPASILNPVATTVVQTIATGAAAAYSSNPIRVTNALARLTMQGLSPGMRVEEMDRGLRWELLTEHPGDPGAWNCLQSSALLCDAVRTATGEIVTDSLQQIITSRDTPGLLNSVVSATDYAPVTDAQGNPITARYQF